MRTILLLGVAAGSLLLAGRATSAEVPVANAQTPASASADFAGDPEPKLDYGAPTAPDVRVYTGQPDRVPSEVEYRHIEGGYDAQGRWTGTWNGTYEAPGGGRYEGTYEGSVESRPGAGYPPPPAYDPMYGRGYDDRDAEMYRRCGRGGTAAGAVVGGVVGGIVGNRVAGHGDRTAGTVIGGALGAATGAAIGNEADKKKCEDWWASRGPHHGGHHGGYYPGGYAYGYPGGATTVYQQGGYGYGYGWYTPGVVVTTIITNGAPLITERVETTTRTYYENAPVRKRYAPAKKKVVRKAKPRCAC